MYIFHFILPQWLSYFPSSNILFFSLINGIPLVFLTLYDIHFHMQKIHFLKSIAYDLWIWNIIQS